MNTHRLTPFFAPRSIAIVGAGERATSSGGAVMQMLKIAGFQGRVVPINPKGGEIFISGDSDIFGNQFLYQQGNPTFMFNLFSYLSTDEDMIKVAPSMPRVSTDFYVTDTALKIYKGFFILGLPVLFFFFGGLIWVRRRWM